MINLQAMNAAPSLPFSRPDEAEALLSQLDRWMTEKPTYALTMLQLSCFRDDRGVIDALYKPAGPPGAPAEARRLRRLRAVVATILEGVRRKLSIPAAQYAAESQVEPMAGVAATADSQNVLYVDPTQTQPPQPTMSAAAPDDGEEELEAPPGGGGDGDVLDGFQLYGLLYPCRGTASSGGAAQDPAQAVTDAMEADRRATVSLDALARSLLRSSAGSSGSSKPAQDNASPTLHGGNDTGPETVDDADHAATATRIRTDAEQALSQLAAEAMRGMDDSRKRVREADADASAAVAKQQQQSRPRQPQPGSAEPVVETTATEEALPAGARSTTAVVDDFDAVTGVEGAVVGSALGHRQPAQQPAQLRHRSPYTAAEDRAILDGVARFSGASRFTKILAQHKEDGVFHSSRTATGLYDRYRHVLRRQRLLAAAAGDVAARTT